MSIFQKTWSQGEIDAVWNKGGIVPDLDPYKYRVDDCGAIIQYDKRGDRSSETNFSWDVDHINPNGVDHISNLRPLHWANNNAKSDGSPFGSYCVVTKKRNQNGSYGNTKA